MWIRSELKEKGKVAFQSNYWRCVLVALVLLILVGSGSVNIRFNVGNNTSFPSEQELSTAASTLGIAGGALLLLGILVFNPAEVGCRRFFLVNSDEPAEAGEMGFAFRNNYGNVVLTMLLRNVYIILWALLFIVPGIIKALSYRLVPYILSENPDMPPKEAITLSRRLMNGNKWNAFVLDLSFIGWELLSAITIGIVGIFFVNPYVAATNAELYKAIRGADAAPAGTEWNDGIGE